MTSDSRPKERCYGVRLRENRRITLAGMAKGTRQIHPQMATLLVLITSDVAIDQRLLARSLQQSVGKSFARLALDGDSSTNDTALLLANAAVDGPPIIDASSWEYGVWQEALDALCQDLAQQIARDAAGTGKLIIISVRGAGTEAMARQVAQSVARSTAMRRAIAHKQPDWGGMFAAVGDSGAEIRPDLLELRLGAVTVMLEGAAVPYDHVAAVQAISANEVELLVDLHMGAASSVVWTRTEWDK